MFDYQSFRTGPICFVQVQIIKTSPEKSNLNLTKMIWTQPKRFVPVPKQFGHIEGQGIIVHPMDNTIFSVRHSRKKNNVTKKNSLV